MFTEGDLDVHTIDGTGCYVFSPNTIGYAVPVDSKLGEVISRAKVGVVFHTTYSGAETLSQMSASFGANISGFKQTPDVWFKDADYSDVSGSVTLTSEESQKFKHTLDAAERKFSKIGLKTWNVLKGHSEFVSIFKVFVNSKIRQGHFLDEPRKSLADFITFYKARKEAEMSKLKTKKGKQTRQTDMDNGVKYFKENFDQLLKLIELYKLLHDAKNIAVRKLHSIQEVGTFIRAENGFKVTTPEGFVAIDHIENAVKLVDRLEFSMQNFNAVKSWS